MELGASRSWKLRFSLLPRRVPTLPRSLNRVLKHGDAILSLSDSVGSHLPRNGMRKLWSMKPSRFVGHIKEKGDIKSTSIRLSARSRTEAPRTVLFVSSESAWCFSDFRRIRVGICLFAYLCDSCFLFCEDQVESPFQG